MVVPYIGGSKMQIPNCVPEYYREQEECAYYKEILRQKRLASSETIMVNGYEIENDFSEYACDENS